MIWAGSEAHERFFKSGKGYTFDINSIAHESSKTSQAVAALESKLKTALAKLIKEMQYSGFDIPTLRQKFGLRVESVIASTVQNVYLESLQYVDRFNEGGVLLSDQDLRTIKETVRKYTDRFWLNAAQIINRNQVLLNDYGYEERNPLNTTSQLSLLASSLTLGLLSQTTIDKAQAMGDPDVKLIWITALDELVCPICRPLHAREWDIGSPDILTPGPGDSHHNCRCRVLLKYKGEIFDN